MLFLSMLTRMQGDTAGTVLGAFNPLELSCRIHYPGKLGPREMKELARSHRAYQGVRTLI